MKAKFDIKLIEILVTELEKKHITNKNVISTLKKTKDLIECYKSLSDQEKHLKRIKKYILKRSRL